MTHTTLHLVTAEPGVYAVHSTSPTVYLIDTRPGRPYVMRARGGAGATRFVGDGEWWPLVELISYPDLSDPTAIDREDFVPDVVRVGRRHRYTWDPGLLFDDQWRLARAAEHVDGPLSAEDLAALTPTDSPTDPPASDPEGSITP
ncbi:hypothetical protein [Xylanimonas ulmi]|uniref:Uncharacterized protein n=1 Tax=Xylanimonas ulmi TaxID=228973 RepID=A0A4Q7M5I9_9MICO|nr:hypothetical protein [Xylanibacterium ulmi]RZS62247.1 hypothetical protein EV386_2572 [Xylanibacterium ulmi]